MLSLDCQSESVDSLRGRLDLVHSRWAVLFSVLHANGHDEEPKRNAAQKWAQWLLTIDSAHLNDCQHPPSTTSPSAQIWGVTGIFCSRGCPSGKVLAQNLIYPRIWPFNDVTEGQKGGLTYPPFWAHPKKRARQIACFRECFLGSPKSFSRTRAPTYQRVPCAERCGQVFRAASRQSGAFFVAPSHKCATTHCTVPQNGSARGAARTGLRSALRSHTPVRAASRQSCTFFVGRRGGPPRLPRWPTAPSRSLSSFSLLPSCLPLRAFLLPLSVPPPLYSYYYS